MEQKICILGDSIAKGVVFDSQRGRYAAAKQSLAKALEQHLGAQVTNLSKFGSTVTEGLRRFEQRGAELEDHGTVILNFGGNDSDFNWSDISAAPEEEHKPKTEPGDFLQTYLALIAAVKERGITPVMLDLPPVEHGRYFSWISRGLNADNILKWLGGSSEFIYRWHEQYSIAVRKIARTANVRLIDIRSPFLEQRDLAAFLCEDGIHPNEQGYGLITQAVLQQLG